MRVVFEAAIVRGDRQTAAPTTGVKTVLGARHRGGQKHHAALPYAEVPAFVRGIQSQAGLPATRFAFEFLILTAAEAMKSAVRLGRKSISKRQYGPFRPNA